jgi:hypothetical protein
LELEDSQVPANYVVRLRAERAGLRKSLLGVDHIQRERFLPSAKAMITTSWLSSWPCWWSPPWVAGRVVDHPGFLSVFFLYLLWLLMVIDPPFKVGQERTDDDVSLFC